MQFNLKIKCADCGQEMDIEGSETISSDFIIEVRPCANCPTIPTTTIIAESAVEQS